MGRPADPASKEALGQVGEEDRRNLFQQGVFEEQVNNTPVEGRKVFDRRPQRQPPTARALKEQALWGPAARPLRGCRSCRPLDLSSAHARKRSTADGRVHLDGRAPRRPAPPVLICSRVRRPSSVGGRAGHHTCSQRYFGARHHAARPGNHRPPIRITRCGDGRVRGGRAMIAGRPGGVQSSVLLLSESPRIRPVSSAPRQLLDGEAGQVGNPPVNTVRWRRQPGRGESSSSPCEGLVRHQPLAPPDHFTPPNTPSATMPPGLEAWAPYRKGAGTTVKQP